METRDQTAGFQHKYQINAVGNTRRDNEVLGMDWRPSCKSCHIQWTYRASLTLQTQLDV